MRERWEGRKGLRKGSMEGGRERDKRRERGADWMGEEDGKARCRAAAAAAAGDKGRERLSEERLMSDLHGRKS